MASAAGVTGGGVGIGERHRAASGCAPPASSVEAAIHRLAGGDQAAMSQLYDRHSGLVRNLAMRILRNAADADDVVQTVFVQAWRQADQYDSARGKPEAWLCTMARTRALDCLRRRASRREEPSEAFSKCAGPSVIVDLLAVRRALAELPARQRLALDLAYNEGLTQTEIAAQLGAPLGTVKTCVRTALVRMRELLGAPPQARTQ